MKRINLMLEYQCFPVWTYGEDGNLIDNNLPQELVGDSTIDSMCVDLQEEFDSLYHNDEKEFKYVGFDNAIIKEAFVKKIFQVLEELKQKVGSYYEINNNINIEHL